VPKVIDTSAEGLSRESGARVGGAAGAAFRGGHAAQSSTQPSGATRPDAPPQSAGLDAERDAFMASFEAERG
jgi:hypothetical protein